MITYAPINVKIDRKFIMCRLGLIIFESNRLLLYALKSSEKRIMIFGSGIGIEKLNLYSLQVSYQWYQYLLTKRLFFNIRSSVTEIDHFVRLSNIRHCWDYKLKYRTPKNVFRLRCYIPIYCYESNKKSQFTFASYLCTNVICKKFLTSYIKE